MIEIVKIVVTYDLVVFEDHQPGRIELSVPKRLSGILVHNRACYDKDVAYRHLHDIINGIAHLQGYSSATVSTIRYANKSQEA